ncbi:G-type lectin S-receptor-like serine/threonine-protein kinase SD2-5 [Vitis vinifera]|uniref:non-specific serine/threonine protein kinase n=1 Tax=Vitis vinifera TaxID=29760 RepID=A0A438HCZ8_VITVI|nr:G-type lectin S-receptor-like serine/threonine-protein kinase SD2-5 [Vitis vinifera]
MGISRILGCLLGCHILFIPFSLPVNALTACDSAANLSSSWINNGSRDIGVDSEDNSTLRPIFLGQGINASFACGFYCNFNCEGYLFAILIFPPPGKYNYLRLRNPKVVWSANQNFLVRDDATLQLTQDGDLILRDADGNLVLFDSNNASVWQSFDHPTDSLVPGQILVFDQKLTASASNKDWSQESRYVIFRKEGLLFPSAQPVFSFPGPFSAQYMKLEPTEQQCFCPGPTAGETRYFTPVNDEEPDLGCAEYLKSREAPSSSNPEGPQSSSSPGTIIRQMLSTFGAFVGLVFIVIIIGRYLILKGKDVKEDWEDKDLLQVPGMPTRFSHEILCINGLSQTKDYFLAEVETIGGIHHLNLVRLVGYCANKSNRCLVYEYMFNGSLDKWIFHRNKELALDWQTRRKIILDIAKGLSYLHEECRQKIIHLDIKPQNILLDESFNAKVSDFGLSKLMDRDQSQVVTTLRGTPGYMAPEWLISAITEKVDVYSFGIVTLEILCGRRNLDHSQPEEDKYLLSLFKRKAEEDQMLDLVDKYSEDMQLHGEEAVELMRLAAWCLQNDNGLGATEAVHRREINVGFASPVLPSILSGPR